MSGKDHFEKEPFDPDVHEAFKRAVASRGSRPSIPNDAGIEAPEEIAERGRAMFRRALMQADADDLQEDLRQMLEALGMSAHARPYSPHRVFQEALNEMKRQLVAVPRSAASSDTPASYLRDIPQRDGLVVTIIADKSDPGAYPVYAAAPTTSPEPDAVREQIVLDAWKNELPNNRFAWPGAPTEFIRVALAALARNQDNTGGPR